MRGRWWLVLFLVVTGAVGVYCLRPPRAPDAVFLVVVDTLRPDRLSCYGYKNHTTAHIDRLSSEGVRFTRAQSAASWTTPSVGALLTSLYPSQLGLTETAAQPGQTLNWRTKREQRHAVIPPHATTLAERLQSAGFRTVAFVNQPGLNASETYQRGFENWYYPIDRGTIQRRDSQNSFSGQSWPSMKYAIDNDFAMIKEFNAWIEQYGQEKVFVWLHLLAPHRPYLPPLKYAPARPENERQRVSASMLYDGEVRAVDDMIGQILDAIERHVGISRSFIIFTSDHGEAFGEHGMYEHGHTLHREVIHVPLVMAGARLPKGRTVDKYVRLIDILPTILDVTGLEPPTSPTLEGVSLLPIIAGKGSDLSVFSEAMLYGSTERSLIEGRYKLMYDQQDEQYKLFEVFTDPYEVSNVAEKHKTRVSSMRESLRDLHNRFDDDFSRWRDANPRNITSQEETLERQRELDALRALGYVGD